MDVASLTVKVVNEGLDDTVKGLGDLGKEAGKTEKASDKLSNSFKKIQDDVKKNTGLSRELKDAVAQLNGAYLDSEGRLHGADGKYLKMTDSMKKAINEVDGLKDALKKQGEEVEKSVRSFEKLKGAVTGFNESVSGLRNAALVGMGALTGILYKSIGSAQEFESAMAEVKKTVDFESPKGIEDMRKGLEELTTQIPQTFGELAATASNAGLLGVAEKDILGFTETVAKMGVAFDLQSDAVAESMAKIANVFQIPIKDIGNLGDVINHLSNNMASTAGEIIDFTKRTASLSATMGLSEDSTAAFGSAMIALGMPAEVAGTAFNAFLGKLANLDGLSKRGKAAFASMGLDATEFAKLMQNDAEAGILKFIETLRDVPKEMQAALAYDALGAELAPKVLAMAAGYEEVARALEMTGDAAGSMEKEFAAISDTSANKMVLFKSNIDLVWSSIGDALIPAFNDLLDAMRPFIESMTDWVRENPELVQGIIIVTGAISGLLLGITGLGLALSGAISIFSGLAAVGGVLATALGFVSLPMIAIVAAIAGIIGAGYMLYKHWDEIKAFASETWDSVKNSASEAWEGVTSSVSGLVDDTVASFQDLGSSISDTWSNIKSSTSQNWESIKSTIVSGAQSAIDAAKSAFASLPTPIQNILTIVYNVVKTQLDLVRNIFSTVLNVIKAAVRGDMQGVVEAFKQGMSNAWNIIKTGATNIVNAIKDLGTKLFRAGVDAVQGLINGIKSKIAGVKSAASELGQAAWGGVKSFLQIRSPSRKMAELGKNTAEGLAKGIKDNKKKAVSEAQKMAEQAVKAVKDTIASLKKEIALFGNDSPLASFDYDVSIGKFAGVPKALLTQNRELIKQKQTLIDLDKQQAESSRKLKAANDSIYSSIESMNRQLYEMGGERSPLEMLVWDLENTNKYANASAEAIEKLKGKTKELFEQQQAQEAAKRANEAAAGYAGVQGDLLGLNNNPVQRIVDEYEHQLAVIYEYEQTHQDILQESADKQLEIERMKQMAMRQLVLASGQIMAGDMSSIFKDMLGEQSTAYRAMFAIEKGFAIAQAGLAIQQNIAQAMKYGFPQNLPFIAGAIAQGAKMMSAIKSVAMPVGQAHDGIMSVPKSGTWNLEKGERVLPAHTAKAMDKKLEKGGGTTVNIYNNAAGVEVEQKINDDGSIDVKIEKRIQQSWNNLANPNSHESKMLGRNVQAPRRR